MMTTLRSFANAIARFLGWSLASLLTVLVAIVCWQVVSRYVLGTPDLYSEEIARIVLMWIGLLGAAYGVHSNAHIGLSLLVDRMPPRMRQAAQLLARLALVAFAMGILFTGGLELVSLTSQLKQMTPALGMPVAYTYLVLPLSGLLIGLFAITAQMTEHPR